MEPFLYLGHFYLELQQDKVKAKKCYQKAFDLDNENEVAGAAVCDIMTAIGQEVKSVDLIFALNKCNDIVFVNIVRITLILQHYTTHYKVLFI